MKKLNLIVTLLMFVFISYAQSTDQCVNCENSTILGENSSVIGFGNEINGNNSVVIGAQSKALSNGSIVIGYDVRTTASNAFIIGNGYGKTGIINNISNSLMIGFNSEKPTLFVSSSNGYESTGKLGIGNVTELEAKLHIKGDDIGKYDASLFIESSNPEKTSIIYLSDKSHHISVSGLGGVMSFSSMQGYNFSSGNVGIGTSNPSARLDVNGTLEINGEANFTQNLIVEGESHFNGIVLDNESDITGADQIVGLNYLRLSGDANGGVDLFIGADGKIGVGTSSVPSDYIMAINGKAIAEEIMIENPGKWYDFVLKEEYDLPKLSEVEIYVKENKHLMDIPSESEVMENGLALGEMNGLLLKKIEELTLYTIEQQKLIEQQQKAFELQNKAFEKQQKEIDFLKNQILNK